MIDFETLYPQCKFVVDNLDTVRKNKMREYAEDYKKNFDTNWWNRLWRKTIGIEYAIELVTPPYNTFRQMSERSGAFVVWVSYDDIAEVCFQIINISKSGITKYNTPVKISSSLLSRIVNFNTQHKNQ